MEVGNDALGGNRARVMLGAFIGLLLATPLLMLQEQSQRFRMLAPIEQNLQRASHGAALVLLVLRSPTAWRAWSSAHAALGVNAMRC